MLSPYRVLDFTDEKGFLCGKVLGDLGADVIKVERPGGDPFRYVDPVHFDPHGKEGAKCETSLYWFALNLNKRGITLNIQSDEGKKLFKELVRKADFVLESFAPGYLDGLGIGYEKLQVVNPRIIVTSITPFGQTGPYRDYKVSDLTAMALGGLLHVTGDQDRPPVRISFPQAYFHAAIDAAAGSMVAHYGREMTGEGQHVDVSIVGSLPMVTGNAFIYWDLEKRWESRRGQKLPWGTGTGAGRQAIYPCKDGYVTFIIYGGKVGATSNSALVKWMAEEDLAPDFLKEKDWVAFDLVKATQEELSSYETQFARFFARHTKDELYRGGLARDMMTYPVATVEDILQDVQLQDRQFWIQMEHPELQRKLACPGPFAKLTETPITYQRRAPLVGEHNKEIYCGELGMSEKELKTLSQAGII